MNELIKFLNQPLPIGIVMLIGIIILWLRVGDIKKEVNGIKIACEKRLKWCLDHFEPKP